MSIQARKYLYICIVISLAVILDQTTKTYLIGELKKHSGYYIEITPFLDLVYAWNYGASFGFMREYYQYSNIGFIIVNSFIIVFLIFMLVKSKVVLQKISLAIIIGGALGNLIDRIVRGAVFDFLYFHYQNFHFPAFNLADSFITIGAVIYFYSLYFSNPKDEKELEIIE